MEAQVATFETLAYSIANDEGVVDVKLQHQ